MKYLQQLAKFLGRKATVALLFAYLVLAAASYSPATISATSLALAAIFTAFVGGHSAQQLAITKANAAKPDKEVD